jgi:FlaA1/EpsC-like NDP-sugar epimerase
VTDARARRFFMSIPEAVRLVLQAAVFGEMAGIFVLDMGRPIEIYELARTMISLSGHVPNVDIPIEFTRLAGAEKLDEELQDDGEQFCKTAHPRVMVIRKEHSHASAEFMARVPQWQSLIRQGEFESLLDEVHRAWPAFRNSNNGKQRAAMAAAGVPA